MISRDLNSLADMLEAATLAGATCGLALVQIAARNLRALADQADALERTVVPAPARYAPRGERADNVIPLRRPRP